MSPENQVRINEAYRDYTPPVNASAIIRKLLRGRYHHRSRNSLPYIELRVDKIVAALKGTPLRIPFLRDVSFGHVLFHELGHHIHDTIRPEYSEQEDVADTWAGKLNANFVRKTYWYGLPVLKIYRLMRRRELI